MTTKNFADRSPERTALQHV